MIVFYLSLLDSEDSRNFLAQLYEGHKKTMFYIANRILKNAQIAENIVHDSFLLVIENLDKFSPNEPEKNRKLIFLIVKRQAINELNRMRRVEYKEDIDEEDSELLIEDFLITKELYEKAISIIRNMDEKHSSVLILKYNGYSIKETSLLLKISEDAVRQRLHRGKEKLVKLLLKEEKDDG